MGLVSCHPAAISCRLGLQIPHPVTPPREELAHGFGSSKPDRQQPGQAPREPRSRNADWGKRQKERELKCWCFMVCIQRSPSARHGGVQPKELCQVRKALHSPSSTFSWSSLRNTWNHLPPWAMLLKVTERALIWGKNQVCLPWPWWLVFQNECPERQGISEI